MKIVEREVLVHDAVHDKVHVLNRTAGFILERCDGHHSIDQIAQELSSTTGVDLDLVTRDVEAIMCEFRIVQLLDHE